MKVATNERDIFLNALEQHDDESRTRYLNDVCADNLELRTKIEELLCAHSEASSFLEQPPPGLALTVRTDGVIESTPELSLDFLAPSPKPGCLEMLGVYEVVGVVGRGAFGIVLRAYDTKLNRIVAIKVMAPELATNPMAVKRFLREAQAAAAVRHDHVVTIHAIDEMSAPPFIVMEFVEGQSLKDKVERVGSLEPEEILCIGKQIAAGLAAAHKEGLVHRDIKPANVLLENGIQRVKITDFGLARAVDDIGITQTGIIAGTPQFMSPEQGLGQSIDARSDLFSLGSLLYTLCTGRAPFRADSSIATLRRVCDHRPRSIREINPEIPTWLEEVVMRLLEKEAKDRFQSAEEVQAVFAKCLSQVQSGRTGRLSFASASEKQRPVVRRTGIAKKANHVFIVTVAMVIPALVGLWINSMFHLRWLRDFDADNLRSAVPFCLSLAGLVVCGSALVARRGLGSVGLGVWVAVASLAAYRLVNVDQVFDVEDRSFELLVGAFSFSSIVWGILVLRRAIREVSTVSRVGDNVRTKRQIGREIFVGALSLQIFGVAFSAGLGAMEITSLSWTGTAFGIALGSVLSIWSLWRQENRFAIGFALSAPIFTVACWIVVLILDPGWAINFTFSDVGFKVVRAVLIYSASAVSLGLVALHYELVSLDKVWQRPQFTLRTVFLGVGLTAFLFAAARPCYDFSVEAYLAAVIFLGAVVLLAFQLALRHNAKPRARFARRLAIISATLGTVLTFAIIGIWHDNWDTRRGYVCVRYANQPVKVRWYNHRTGGRHEYQFDPPLPEEIREGYQLLPWASYGLIAIEVVDNDKFKVNPSRLYVKRNMPVDLHVVPIDSPQ